MKRIHTLILSVLTALILSSCGQRDKTQPSKTSIQPNNTAQSVIESPDASETSDTVTIFPFFEEAYVAPEPFRLCEQKLTSQKEILSEFPESEEDFFMEFTPERDAFYLPKADIKDNKLVRTVQLRNNYAALFNRVLHSYEWFDRMSSMDDEEEDETHTTTKQDTLNWIRTARPDVSKPVLERAIPDADVRALAEMLLKAYDLFDGDDSADSPFSEAMARYADALPGLPELVSDEDKDRFEKQFWDWYDKEKVIPGIDGIIKMHLYDFNGEELTDLQIENMRRAVEAEKDIDRRTILALEYAKFDGWGGAILLGEILESRIYTKYLLEAWISWRANVQMNHSPSSFSIIANNYYDMMRARCLDTMVRHCLQTEDKKAECLIENMIFCEIIHRMGSLMGNSSLATLADLSYSEFIHPRLLK